MSYTLGIPSDGQSLGNSKPQVRANFTEIFNTFAVDHVGYNSGGAGRHKFVHIVEGAAPTTGTNEGALYTSDTKGGFTNLFWKQESGGAVPEKNQGESIQMTNITPSNTPTGRSFLPGGMLIQWGSFTTGGDGSNTTVTFNVPFDAATVPYSVLLTFAQTVNTITTLSVRQSNITNADFQAHQVGAGNWDVYYLAIGKRET
jgi:hypothetical protein